jgi:hypothetical protein
MPIIQSANKNRCLFVMDWSKVMALISKTNCFFVLEAEQLTLISPQ